MDFNQGNTGARILFLAVLQVLPAFVLDFLAPAVELPFLPLNGALIQVYSLVLSTPAYFLPSCCWDPIQTELKQS